MAGHALMASTVTAKTSAASGQDHGHPGAPAPGVLLVGAGGVGHTPGQRGPGAWHAAGGVAGMLPAAPPMAVIYLMLEDLLQRLGLRPLRAAAGSSTWDR